MKTMKNLLILFLFLFATMACEEEPEDKDAPALPPAGSFVMEFGDFSNTDTSSALLNKETMTYVNWGHAAFNVGVWNAFITIGMAIPVVSFLESFNHEATYHPDEENWTWSYGFTANGEHEAELTGYFENDSVVWEMRIDGFLWYYGHSDLNGTGGYWMINKSEEQPVQLVRIDWNHESEDVADIRYMNVEPGGAENGGYITYGKLVGDLDRFYDIYNKGASNLMEIEWSSLDKHGRVKDPWRFGDEEWHCWDSTLNDIECN